MDTADSESLRIEGGNVMHCGNRVRQTLDFATARGRQRPKVIYGQDPPPNILVISHPEYYLWYGNGTQVLNQAQPASDQPQPAPDQDQPEDSATSQPPRLMVYFYILKTIDTSQWRVREYEGENRNLVATLMLQTTAGRIAIHNAYNWRQQINFDKLVRKYFAQNGADLLLVDSNLHWFEWGGLDMTQRPEPKAHLFANAMNAGGLVFVGNRGQDTYQRTSTGKFSSVIDVVYAGSIVADRILECKLVKPFPQDHLHHSILLDMAPSKFSEPRYCWSKANPEKVKAATIDSLKDLDLPPLRTPADIDAFLTEFMSRLRRAFDKTVPKTRRSSKGHQRTVDLADQKRTQELGAILAFWKTRYNEAKSEREREIATEAMARFNAELDRLGRKGRTISFRRAVAMRTKNCKTIFQWLKSAGKWCEPKERPHMDDIRVGEKVYKTGDAKADEFARQLWPGASRDPRPPPPLPTTQPPKSRVEICQKLSGEETTARLQHLASRKASGSDVISTNFIRLTCPIISIFVTHLFQACLLLGYHPLLFKDSKIFLTRKGDKARYDTPKSWRPIALLSTLGKVLEKIVADRIKQANILSSCLFVPLLQFGGSGRCCSKAVRYLLTPVYRAWTDPKGTRVAPKIATLLGLDMSGAYDNVNHRQLFERLAEKGHNPSGPIYVFVGIPQGSPLSSILFHIFASPILEKFGSTSYRQELRDRLYANSGTDGDGDRRRQDPCTDVISMAFVDDTYFLATSPSREENCRLLEMVHGDLMVWAHENGVAFNPSKYRVKHFRKPDSGEAECRLLPRIDGLDEKTSQVRYPVRVLGVILDDKLKWEDHISSIEKKVQKRMQNLGRMSTSVWGPSLPEMRRLYITSVRTIIAWACGVWYMRGQGIRWKLSHKLIERLEKLQDHCLWKISGANQSTSRDMLRQILCIEPIETYLQSLAMAFRARALSSEEYDAFHQLQVQRLSPELPKKEWVPAYRQQHPYYQLDLLAKEIEERAEAIYARSDGSIAPVWHSRRKRNIAIDKLSRTTRKLCAEKEWDRFRFDRWHKAYNQPILLEPWGRRTLSYYRHSNRAECTILLQMQTGHIGLNPYLFKCNSVQKQYASSPNCKCGKRQTARHLFTDCPLLNAARSILRRDTNAVNFDALMTRQAHKAASWALWAFRLPQFELSRARLGCQYYERYGNDMVKSLEQPDNRKGRGVPPRRGA